MKKIILLLALLLIAACSCFAFDLKDVLKANIGHEIAIDQKSVEGRGVQFGIIIDVNDEYVITQMSGGKYTLYTRLDDIVCISITNDVTQKK